MERKAKWDAIYHGKKDTLSSSVYTKNLQMFQQSFITFDLIFIYLCVMDSYQQVYAIMYIIAFVDIVEFIALNVFPATTWFTKETEKKIRYGT